MIFKAKWKTFKTKFNAISMGNLILYIYISVRDPSFNTFNKDKKKFYAN